MTTTLVGKGKGMLEFGNCWKTGVVKVYLDGSQIESAGPGEFKVVLFEYNDGSKLEIGEFDTAIIQINNFVLGKQIILKNLKCPTIFWFYLHVYNLKGSCHVYIYHT